MCSVVRELQLATQFFLVVEPNAPQERCVPAFTVLADVTWNAILVFLSSSSLFESRTGVVSSGMDRIAEVLFSFAGAMTANRHHNPTGLPKTGECSKRGRTVMYYESFLTVDSWSSGGELSLWSTRVVVHIASMVDGETAACILMCGRCVNARASVSMCVGRTRVTSSYRA